MTEYLERAGPDRAAVEARLRPRRLRLHDLHRELGAAAGGRVQGDRGARPRGGERAVGQPQLRGPHPPRGEDELPRLAAALRGVRAGRPDGPRHRERAAPERRLPARHLADAAGGERHDRERDRVGHVPALLRRRAVRGRRQLEVARDPGGRPLRLGRRVHLREAAALLRGHAGRGAGRLRADRGRPRDRAARRQRHHGPHLAGRRDQEGLTRGRVPDRARSGAARVQLLRLAARQPRGDDARHLREHPAAQPARARTRRAASRRRTARPSRSTTPPSSTTRTARRCA